MAKITFNQISIENFGPFRERQTLNLDATHGRPVILIKALNGSGKTTLLTALQICLYGYKAINPFRRNEYEQLVAGLHRKDAVGNASIEVTLTIEIGSNNQTIMLKRAWDAKSNISESFVAINNGIEDIEFTENWDEFVNGILPVELVQLFLFDGEKIEALANPESLPKLLRRATEVFLGLGGIDTLTSDLKALERRSNIKNKDSSGEIDKNSEQLEVFQQQLIEIDKRIAVLVQKQGEVHNHLDQAQHELEKFTLHARKNGIEAYKQASELKANVESATKQHKDARQALIDSLEDPILPLAWLGPLWDQYKLQWDKDSQAHNAKLLITEFEKRDAKILSVLNKIDSNAHETVVKLFKEDISEFKLNHQHDPVLIPEADHSEVQLQLEQVVKSLKLNLVSFESATNLLEKAERSVSQIPAEEQLADIFDELQIRSKSVTTFEGKLRDHEHKIEEARTSYSHIESRLNASRQRFGSAYTERMLEAKGFDAAIRAKKALNIFRERLLASKAEWLSDMITNEFKSILRKHNLVSRVVINPITYVVSIEDTLGYTLPMERLSAGERQILAIAVLSALIAEHKGLFPVVVDTPLARLDSHHRDSLIRNFFAKISHQVMVLSTDEEVDGTTYKSLAPYISQEYVLVYDDETRRSIAKARNTIELMSEAL